MKINELRIGCSFQLENGTLGGGVATIGHIKDMVTASELLESGSLSAIPLTEDWLLKLGFEKLIGWDDMTYFNNNGIHIYLCGNGREEDWFEYENDIIIKSVHKLQNLYFVLTSENLIIKT